MEATKKGGKKNRKFGRNKNSPAATRYRNEHRSDKNKRRNIAKNNHPKVLKVPRGTARALRRVHLQGAQSA